MVSEGLQECLVELAVTVQESADVAFAGCENDVGSQRLEWFRIGAMEIFGDFAHRWNFQHGTELENLVQILLGQDRYAESLVADDFHNSQVCQIHDSFADRGNRHT